MKTKKNKRKLALNKMSIASLDKIEIHEVKGGSVIFNGPIKEISDVCTTKYPPKICNFLTSTPC